MEELNQEILMKAQMLHQQSQEVEQQLDFINKQVLELEDFSGNLSHLIISKNKESLSSLGKGVYLKTEIKDKRLFVEVGAGVVVRKTPEETRKVIEGQISRFQDLKSNLNNQLNLYKGDLMTMIQSLESQREK